MPVSTIERPVIALRQRMIEDMAMRGLRSLRTVLLPVDLRNTLACWVFTAKYRSRSRTAI
jgi:hypothetical protein